MIEMRETDQGMPPLVAPFENNKGRDRLFVIFPAWLVAFGIIQAWALLLVSGVGMAAKEGIVAPEVSAAKALLQSCLYALTIIAPVGIYSLFRASHNDRNGLGNDSILLRTGLWMGVLTALIGLYTLFGPLLQMLGMGVPILLFALALISMAYMSFFYLYHPKMGGKA